MMELYLGLTLEGKIDDRAVLKLGLLLKER